MGLVAQAGGVIRSKGGVLLPTAVVAAAAYRDTVLADSPALYWELEETSGTNAADSSGNGHAGTHTNGPTVNQTGKEGKCVSYDGTDDFTVATGYNPFVAGSSRTFEGWGWRNNTSGYHVLIGGNLSARLYVMTGSTEVRWEANAGFGSGANWPGAWPGTAQWVHWALTFDESTDVAELFINGVSQGTHADTEPYNTGDTSFNAGRNTSGASYWNGKLDEIAVYHSILSSARIAAHYAAA